MTSKSRIPHLRLLSILLLLSIIVISNNANAELDRSRIVVKLVSDFTSPPQWSKSQSGREDFDRIARNASIDDIRPVFPSVKGKTRLRQFTISNRLQDYIVIRVPNCIDPDKLLNQLQQSPDVETAEFDGVVRTTESQLSPNDTYFATYQYALVNDGTQPTWDLPRPPP